MSTLSSRPALISSRLRAEGAPPVLPLVGLLVFLILATACANLGGLLMARGAGRQREIQLRFDLGARKLRVFRQLLTENLLLGLLGSIAALPLSYGVLRLVLVYSNAPAWMSALPDWRVFLFTTAMGFVAALLFGLLPTLQMVRRKKNRSLWHQFVVCAQVGASCVLLILAGLLVRATLHTLYSDPGFGYEQVLSIDPGMKRAWIHVCPGAGLPRSVAEPAAGSSRRDLRLDREDSSAGEHNGDDHQHRRRTAAAS